MDTAHPGRSRGRPRTETVQPQSSPEPPSSAGAAARPRSTATLPRPPEALLPRHAFELRDASKPSAAVEQDGHGAVVDETDLHHCLKDAGGDGQASRANCPD